MRVLIIGAGIAGLSLAGLLRRQSIDVVLIERAHDFAHAGYGVGIYPIALPVFERLGLSNELMQIGTPYRTYTLHDATGTAIETIGMTDAFAEFGAAVGLRRPDLIGVLLRGIGDLPIRFATTALRLIDRGDAVEAELSDGTSDAFDLVAGCDGARSATRAAILASGDCAETDSGWSAVYLVLSGDGERGEIHEFYGRDHVVGTYPVGGGLLCGLAAPRELLPGASGEQLAAFLRSRWSAVDAVERIAAACETQAVPFQAELRDARCSHWSKGHRTLVGDAACSFIPSAGFGTTMALLSAAALAGELSRPQSLDDALREYERKQKPFTEAGQQQSRELAKAMFAGEARASIPAAYTRDALQLMRAYASATLG